MQTHRVRMLSAALLAILAGCGGLASRLAGQPAYTREGSQLKVGPAGDLQSALNEAKPGDTIVLEAGAIYRGHWTLPVKTGDGVITIQTSAMDKLPPADTRVKPADAVFMPKLVCKDCPALDAASASHHYRMVGLEVYPEAGVYADTLIRLGTGADATMADLPHDMEVDRSILHGDPVRGSKRAISLNGRTMTVKNSHMVDFFSDFQDAQAILGWNGAGPFWIVNNYMEASGENVMFGGAAPRIQGLTPSDIQVLHNHFYKPERYRNVTRIKNLFELKHAQRVKVIGNLFENNWAGAQNGFGILFTVRTCEAGDYSWAVVADVEFKYNILRHSEGGAINISGRDEVRADCAGPRLAGATKNISITDNLFDDIGAGFQLLSGAENIRVEHNTFLNKKWILYAAGDPSPGVVLQNNIFLHGGGIFGDSMAEGNAGIARYMPRSVVKQNVFVGAPEEMYPRGNFFPEEIGDVKFVSAEGHDFRLQPKSKYREKGTDKKDIGPDFSKIDEETKGVVEGVYRPAGGAAAQ